MNQAQQFSYDMDRGLAAVELVMALEAERVARQQADESASNRIATMIAESIAAG